MIVILLAVIALFFIGGLTAPLNATETAKDIAQYAVGFAMAFTSSGMILTVRSGPTYRSVIYVFCVL